MPYPHWGHIVLEVKPNPRGYNKPSSNYMLVWSFKEESGSSLWPPKTTFASLDSETWDANLCRLLNRMRQRFSWADPTAKIVVCIGVGRSATHPHTHTGAAPSAKSNQTLPWLREPGPSESLTELITLPAATLGYGSSISPTCMPGLALIYLIAVAAASHPPPHLLPSPLPSGGHRRRVRETFELNQLKCGASQLLPVFSGFDQLQTCCRSFGPANLLFFLFSTAG